MEESKALGSFVEHILSKYICMFQPCGPGVVKLFKGGVKKEYMEQLSNNYIDIDNADRFNIWP